MRIRHTTVASTLDPITLVATDDAITGLYFRHHVRRPAADTLGPQLRAAEVGAELDDFGGALLPSC